MDREKRDEIISALYDNKDITMSASGYYIYWPLELQRRPGHTSEMLRVIADELDKKNGQNN